MKLTNSPERNAVMMILLPIVYIIVGAILLFDNGINTKVFASLLGVGLVITGAAMVIKYFLSKSYLNYSSYGFTGGVLLVFLGIIIMTRVNDVASGFTVCLGIGIMLTSVIKLQNAIQLLSVGNRTWIAVMSVAVAFIAMSFLILINPFRDRSVWEKFTYVMLIIDGAVGLFLNIYMYFNAGRKKTPRTPVKPKEDKKNTDITPLDIDKD